MWRSNLAGSMAVDQRDDSLQIFGAVYEKQSERSHACCFGRHGVLGFLDLGVVMIEFS